MVIASSTLTAPAAWANQNVGSDHAYAGTGHQFGSWDTYGYNKPRVGGWVSTGNLSNNRCNDLFYDWEVEAGGGSTHFDDRIIRNCRSDTERQINPGGNGFNEEEVPADRELTGSARGGGCVYRIVQETWNDTDGNLTCLDHYFDAIAGFGDGRCEPALSTEKSVAFWVRWEGGSVDYYDGASHGHTTIEHRSASRSPLKAIGFSVLLTLTGCSSDLMDHFDEGYSAGEGVRPQSCDRLTMDRYGIDARVSHGDEAPPEAEVYWGGCVNAATGLGRVSEDQLYLFTEPPPGG